MECLYDFFTYMTELWYKEKCSLQQLINFHRSSVLTLYAQRIDWTLCNNFSGKHLIYIWHPYWQNLCYHWYRCQVLIKWCSEGVNKSVQLRPVLECIVSGWLMTMSWSGNIFRVTGHLCGEFAAHRSITLTKASYAELWCFLWSASE